MSVSESQFNMWRSLFALAHADHVVTPEEVRFMAEALEDVPFSAGQHDQLMDDAKMAQDIEALFRDISDVKDQAEFFSFAHTLVYIDGDFAEEEREVMAKLKALHAQHPDIDTLDEDFQGSITEHEGDVEPPIKRILMSFRNWFLNERLD